MAKAKKSIFSTVFQCAGSADSGRAPGTRAMTKRAGRVWTGYTTTDDGTMIELTVTVPAFVTDQSTRQVRVSLLDAPVPHDYDPHADTRADVEEI